MADKTLKWETLGFGSNTSTIISRTPIFGGWLVTSSTEHPAEPNSVSITFVPDKHWEWDLTKKYGE